MIKQTISFLLLICCYLGVNKIYACDESTASLSSVTDNGNGTYTVVIDVCTEFLGLEATAYSWSIDFNDPLNILSATPATLTTGTGDNYNLSIAGGTATWTNSGFLPSHTGTTFCYTVNLIVDAQPTTTVDVITNNDAAGSFANCTHTLPFPVVPPACSISATATPSACNPADNTYSADVTVTYSNPPATGTLDVNGNSFAIGTSPQTVTLTGLTSDGNSVDLTAAFSDDAGCTFTQTNAYTAPTSCTPCTINATAVPSACNPADNTYSVDVTVTYSNPPATGTLDVNGNSFAIGTSPQTVTLTGLTSDGNSVDLTAAFSDDAVCTFTQTNAYTAPTSCTPCTINATASPSACNPADNTYSVDITVTYSNPPTTGTLDVNGNSYAITSSPQIITLTGLTSDGNPVDVTAEFSDDPGCTFTQNGAYTAPSSCTSCNANAGTISQ